MTLIQYTRPQSLADVADRVRAGDNLPFMVKEFMDDWRKSPSVDRLDREPPLVDAITDAILAAIAEHLSAWLCVAPPEWSAKECRFLVEPLFWGRSPAIREMLLVETPSAFRRRLIFCGRILES